MVRYLIVLDFEATCWDDETKKQEHEIIEFPSVVLDLETGEIVDRIEQFVKPRKNPRLSEFCKRLTSIRQDQVDGGIPFLEAFKRHQIFISKYPDSALVTCGDWDLKTMLPAEAKAHGLKVVPSPYRRWINIKRVFRDRVESSSTGMPQMLEALDLKLQGTHHRGIDDCVNIAQIALELKTNYAWKPSL